MSNGYDLLLFVVISNSFVNIESALEEKECHFPFYWKGKSYHACTDVDSEYLWCGLDAYEPLTTSWKKCDSADVKRRTRRATPTSTLTKECVYNERAAEVDQDPEDKYKDEEDKETVVMKHYLIPGDGLLLGWRFYCKRMKPWHSFATIWRRIQGTEGQAGREYKIIAEDKIECDAEGPTEVKLKVPVEVKRSDMMGLIHDPGRADCGNIIATSYDPHKGYDAEFANINQELRVGDKFQFTTSARRLHALSPIMGTRKTMVNTTWVPFHRVEKRKHLRHNVQKTVESLSQCILTCVDDSECLSVTMEGKECYLKYGYLDDDNQVEGADVYAQDYFSVCTARIQP